jgi:hypothetical protein
MNFESRQMMPSLIDLEVWRSQVPVKRNIQADAKEGLEGDISL